MLMLMLVNRGVTWICAKGTRIPSPALRTSARAMQPTGNAYSGKSGGRGMFEMCLEGATKQNHVCIVWPVYPANTLAAKSAPVGWRPNSECT
jgi:hypothetical protein